MDELVELEKKFRQLQRRTTGRIQRRLRKGDEVGAARAHAQSVSYGYAATLVARKLRAASNPTE